MDQPLQSLAALSLDCQTTGANAGRDHLLEIGWVSVGPASVVGHCDPSAYLVALPEGVALPSIITYTLDDRKRAASHAVATGVIWENLIPLLAAEGIRKWSVLVEWLDRPRASRRVLKNYPMPRALRLETPDHPGVYRLRRSNGDLLYVGKARSLKRRINSYFQSRRRHPEHILEMLTQARDLDFMPTPTALEAALLDADLIKQAAPPYNILLKPRETAPVFFQTISKPQVRPITLVFPLDRCPLNVP